MKPYSKRRRKKSSSLRAYGPSKKVIAKKSERKDLPLPERRLFALAFGDIVTKRKPRFYESWDKTTREDYFEISVTEITIHPDRSCATIYIMWTFKATKRYCCNYPNCHLGKGQQGSRNPITGYLTPKKEWWQELRKALKNRGFNKELPPMRVTLIVNMPELEVEHQKNSFTYVEPHQRSYEWYETV